MKKIVIAALLSLLLSLLKSTPSLARVIEPDLESALSKTSTEKDLPIIITLSDKLDLTPFKDSDKSLRRSKLIKALREKAESSQVPLRKFLEERGVKQIRAIWTINGMLVRTRPSVIRKMADQPGVERIRLDQTQKFRERLRDIRKQSPRSLKSKRRTLSRRIDPSPETKPEWNMDLIHAPELWHKGFTGEGIVIASMDTGVDLDHPDLKNKWRGGKNSWFDPHGQYEIPDDVNGHGTQTMGIMVGGSAGETAIGVAPGAKWIAVKLYNDAGQTSLGVCHLGFQWLLDPDGNPDTDDLPDVVNFSWGFNQNVNQCNPEFLEDVRVLRVAQIAVIFAGGNEGPNSSTSVSPANYTNSFSVGAVDQSLKPANFSSRGPSACDASIYPKVVAPGVSVRTPDLTFRGAFPNSYATVTGTSFAAAHVSGAMALLLSAFPNLSVLELESALKQSAKDLGNRGVDNAYGYGLVDTVKAYRNLSTKKFF